MSAPFSIDAALAAKSAALDALIQEGRDAVAKFNAFMDGAIAAVKDGQTAIDNINEQVTALAPTIQKFPQLVTDLDTAIKNFKVNLL